MKTLLVLAALALGAAAALLCPAPALAQGCGASNPNCIVPTAPVGTSNNQAASTAFVHNNAGIVDSGTVCPPPAGLNPYQFFVDAAGGVNAAQLQLYDSAGNCDSLFTFSAAAAGAQLNLQKTGAGINNNYTVYNNGSFNNYPVTNYLSSGGTPSAPSNTLSGQELAGPGYAIGRGDTSFLGASGGEEILATETYHNQPQATGTMSITGTAMDITAITGSVVVGQIVTCPTCLPNTVITALGASGQSPAGTGGTGWYTVDVQLDFNGSVTVGSANTQSNIFGTYGAFNIGQTLLVNSIASGGPISVGDAVSYSGSPSNLTVGQFGGPVCDQGGFPIGSGTTGCYGVTTAQTVASSSFTALPLKQQGMEDWHYCTPTGIAVTSICFSYTGNGSFLFGVASSLGSVTGGSGYVDGTYYNVELTDTTGTGTGAYANITVSGGSVCQRCVLLTQGGGGYGGVGSSAPPASTLTAANTSLGGSGSGFSVPVSAPTGVGGSISSGSPAELSMWSIFSNEVTLVSAGQHNVTIFIPDTATADFFALQGIANTFSGANIFTASNNFLITATATSGTVAEPITSLLTAAPTATTTAAYYGIVGQTEFTTAQTATGASFAGGNFVFTNSGAGHAGAVNGAVAVVSGSGTGTIDTGNGLNGSCYESGLSGTILVCNGGNFTARTDATNSTTSQYNAVYALAEVTAASTIATLRAGDFNLQNNGGGTLSNGARGISIETPVGGLSSNWGQIYGENIGDMNPTGTNVLPVVPVALNIGNQSASGAYSIKTGTGLIAFGGSITASALSTSGTVAGAICATSAGLLLYETAGCGIAASGITVGTTTVASGTSTYILYNNAGVLGNEAQVPLANGGTNASLTASNGGIVYSTASALGVRAGTATADQMLLSGASAAPSWSTAIWPTDVAGSGYLLNSSAAHTWTASNAPTIGTSLTVPLIDGGTGAASQLNFQATSNGSPSGDEIAFSVGGATIMALVAHQDSLTTTITAATAVNLVNSLLTQNLASTNSNATNAGLFENQLSSSATAGISSTARGFLSEVVNSSNQSITTAHGLNGQIDNASVGSILTGYAGVLQVINNGQGTCGTCYALEIAQPIGTGTGTSIWTTLAGINIENQTPSGAGTNLPGSVVALNIVNQGATNYAIKVGTGLNSFAGGLLALSGTANTAGGAAAAGLTLGSNASPVGVYFGSGVPTISAPQGSVYMRTDGSSATTRFYINTNGSTTWTAVTTQSWLLKRDLDPASNDNSPVGLSAAA